MTQDDQVNSMKAISSYLLHAKEIITKFSSFPGILIQPAVFTMSKKVELSLNNSLLDQWSKTKESNKSLSGHLTLTSSMFTSPTFCIPAREFVAFENTSGTLNFSMNFDNSV